MDSYHRISSRLKLGPVGEDCILNRASSLPSRQATDEPEIVGYNRPNRIPVRLYVRSIDQNLDDLEDVLTLANWDSVSYINRAVEVHKEGGNYMTLKHAMRYLLPEVFGEEAPSNVNELDGAEEADSTYRVSETICTKNDLIEETNYRWQEPSKSSLLIRIQGIEPDLDIPFAWVVNNLKNPDYFLHICVFVSTSSKAKAT